MQANAFSNQKQLNANIAPSLICADLCNLARDIDRMESIGCQMLHIDIIDGYFSPSMPIGIDTIRQLRQITTMQFDAHIMAKDNTFFVNELLSIGVDRLCFQIECEPTPGALLQKIHNGHSKAGIALAPTTSLSHLEYVIEECDFVLLMQIDPGYAFLPGIQKRTYMNRMRASYSPYSRHAVGAALLCENGQVFLGCNVENASYGLTNCAERSAVFNAISSGNINFSTLAIAAEKEPPWPCGACRQVLNEFAPQLRIIVTWGTQQVAEASLNDLLPHSFGPNELNADYIIKNHT